MDPLHQYQKRAIAWGLERDHGYFAVDMGLGKTRIMLELIKRFNGPVIVVAPMRVACHTWPHEILKWAPDLTYTVLHGRTKEECVQLNRNVYIINYAGLPWLMRMLSKYGRSKFLGAMVIFDESTAVKSNSSSQSKLAVQLRSICKKCFMLSASPVPNGMHDLFQQYLILDHGASLGTGYTNFMNKYFITLPSRTVKPRDDKVVNEITKLVHSSTFRLDAKDYLQLPEFIENKIELHLPEKLRGMYTQLEQEFLLQLNAVTVTAVSAATLSMKLRQFIQGAMYINEQRDYEVIHELKLDALEQCLEELNTRPALIPIQFKFELEQIRKRFGKLPAITGGVAPAESNRLLDLWNRGATPALIVHPASISHGVNLQSGGHNIIWYAQTWNYEHYSQLNGRLRRQGQPHPVVLTFLTFAKTIEQRIMTALTKKGATQQSLLDALNTDS